MSHLLRLRGGRRGHVHDSATAADTVVQRSDADARAAAAAQDVPRVEEETVENLAGGNVGRGGLKRTWKVHR